MSDRIVRALVNDRNLLAVAVVATDATREARRRHSLAPSSAALLGQALTGGLLIAALQKAEKTRINIQIECDGPAGGVFVDANPLGQARGYVRNKVVRFPPEPRFTTAPLLGKSGYVSVLRDVEGEFYRGTVDLDGDLSLDLERYFAVSEQTDTTLQLEALAQGDEELGWVGGILIQRLPDGDEAALADIRARLRSGVIDQAARVGALTAHGLLDAVLGTKSIDLLADHDAQYFCPCTRERVFRALSVLSNIDLIEMITQEHKAQVDCEFCGAHYEVGEPELRQVLDAIDRRDAEATQRGNEPLN